MFAGYSILRLLGSGGMGEVYLAQHPRLPRRDALKILRADVSSDATFGERFIREADLAAALWHPHVVGVHDRGEDQGQLWIAMDYVDGVDAAQLMRRRYPAGMPADEVAGIVTAVASALDYAHKRGLLHRDVKPANIMLAHLDDDDEERRVLLTDFGIARELDTVSGLTTTNMTVGTVAYAAPEQLMGEDIDGRADQYALAATAYHLLTGTLPFPHSNPAVVISHHLTASPPALADTRAELATLDLVLAVALAKDPDERYTRCSDFARAFAEQIAGDAPSPTAPTAPAAVRRSAAAAPPRPPTVPAPPAGKSSSARRWLPLGAAAALVMSALVGALVWRPWHSQQDGLTPTAGATSETIVAQGSPTSSAHVTAVQTMPATAIDSVLLTAAEIGNLLGGIEVSSEPGGTVGAVLKLDSSSYGPSDHSRQVDPSSCVSVAFTGDQASYGGTDVEAMKTESFSPGTYATGDQGPTQLEQTVAVFRSAESAQSFLATQQSQWTACTSPQNPPYPDFPEIDVSVLLGYENGRSFIVGNVDRSSDMISVSMASNNPVTGAHACQQALAARNNVVVEARTCQVPSTATSIPPMEPADPAWAVPNAQRLVMAMLKKVA